MKIGSAKYGGGKKKFTPKNGDNIYGILPPMGELADAGRWSVYYRVEWGFKDSDGKLKPFQDVRVVNRQTGMVDVESAAHLQRGQLIKNKEDLLALFKAGQATQDQVKDATDLVKRYNLDCKHYMNVITPTGEIGTLKIGHKAKLALDAAIQALRDQGVEPIGMTGVYFNINRFIPKNAAGKEVYRDTTYTVTPYNENVQADVNGQTVTVQQRKEYILTDAIISRLPSEAEELSKLFPVVTAEDVQRFVTEGATAVDEILGKTEGATAETTAAPAAAAPTPAPQAVAPAPTPAPQAVAPAPTPATTEVAAPVAETSATPPVAETAPAATTPAPAPEQPAAQATTETTTAPTADPNTMSDEEFLASIGAQ